MQLEKLISYWMTVRRVLVISIFHFSLEHSQNLLQASWSCQHSAPVPPGRPTLYLYPVAHITTHRTPLCCWACWGGLTTQQCVLSFWFLFFNNTLPVWVLQVWYSEVNWALKLKTWSQEAEPTISCNAHWIFNRPLYVGVWRDLPICFTSMWDYIITVTLHYSSQFLTYEIIVCVNVCWNLPFYKATACCRSPETDSNTSTAGCVSIFLP